MSKENVISPQKMKQNESPTTLRDCLEAFVVIHKLDKTFYGYRGRDKNAKNPDGEFPKSPGSTWLTPKEKAEWMIRGLTDDVLERSEAESKALAGCPDPELFIEVVTRMYEEHLVQFPTGTEVMSWLKAGK